MKNTILTGDRPTGPLHIGHYVGSIKRRLEIQDSGDYDKFFIMIADAQALTDNYDNPEKVRENIVELMLDYLSCGLDTNKVTIFVQTQIPELCELTFYYMNLVTEARLHRNPTVKSELIQKGMNESIPVGFLVYPVSQTADITAFNANIVPVGDDQLPMIEQAREIVRSFNNIYGNTLIEPVGLLPQKDVCRRLPGTNGKEKMSKSLGNCIYLSDSESDIKKKVMAMYTDPNHIKVEDPGKIEGNIVFTYLDAFCEDEHFKKYLPEYKNLDELKKHYINGGLGDTKIKLFLNSILQELLEPIRNRRKKLEKDIPAIYKLLEQGSKIARATASETLTKVRNSMKIEYFNDKELIEKQSIKYNKN